MPFVNMAKAAARPSDLKLNNRAQILELFKSGDAYSVGEIADRVGISRQTVMKSILYFLEKGIIESVGKAAAGSMGGKRAELFALSADRYLCRVLICPNKLITTLISFRCEVICTLTREMPVSTSVEELIDAAAVCIEASIDDKGLSFDCLYGVCVAIPGFIDRETNRLVFNTVPSEWGRDIPIGDMISDRLRGVRVILESIGRLCGRAVAQSGPYTNERILTLFGGWGNIASSFMDHGVPVDGKGCLTGEIGHMVIEPTDDEVCGCGMRGCFERQVCPERLQRMIAEHADDHPDSCLTGAVDEPIPITRVFGASAAGDALARMISSYVGNVFGHVLYDLLPVFGQDTVILQGDLAEMDDRFSDAVFDYMKDSRCMPSDGIRPFELKSDRRPFEELTTIGAYALLIDELFGTPADT